MAEIFTVGHSDRTIGEFISLLTQQGIEHVLDVRKLAGSNKYPHFNADTLAQSLAQSGIGYSHAPKLSGRRPVSKEVDFEVNAWWTNRSLHNYADYALSPDFSAALDQLIELSAQERTAIMCAEAVWWRCHRRIIADHLIARGQNVLHLIDAHEPKPAQLSDGAQLGEQLTYPRKP
ncbi:DUF488 domain-containing protein [Glutamicibacter arilaitensis]|uniref:DUF488 domain-containing protein n=1 Tax=Glutamicibacter arilaitensis TaxID=256701 RepID=UPI003FD0808C